MHRAFGGIWSLTPQFAYIWSGPCLSFLETNCSKGQGIRIFLAEGFLVFAWTGQIPLYIQVAVCECPYGEIRVFRRVVTLIWSLWPTFSGEPRGGFCLIWNEPTRLISTVLISSTSSCDDQVTELLWNPLGQIHPPPALWLNYRSTMRTFTVYSTIQFQVIDIKTWLSLSLPSVATLDCGVLTSSPVTQIIGLQLSLAVLRNSDQSMWNFSFLSIHTQKCHFPVLGLPWPHVTDFFGHIKILNFTNK